MRVQPWFHQETDRFPIQRGGKNRYLSGTHFHAKHTEGCGKRAGPNADAPCKSQPSSLKTEHLFNAGRGPVLGPVGIAFQATFETVYSGGGAYLASGFRFIFVLKIKRWRSPQLTSSKKPVPAGHFVVSAACRPYTGGAWAHIGYGNDSK
jgi:hypothetical protein